MTKANCTHLVEGKCTHPRTHCDTCVLDDIRAHQCRLVYNDKRRPSVLSPLVQARGPRMPKATPFSPLGILDGQG